MEIELFRDYCLSLPGTTEGMKWGEHLCFMVHEKIYVIISLEEGGVSFKCDPEDFEELVANDGIEQAAHFAKRQWVSLSAVDVLPDLELKNYVSKSRGLVINKLPKKFQALYL